jgi:N-carbamoylputrescine amidase
MAGAFEIVVAEVLPSLVRVAGHRPDAVPLRIGVVQHAWDADAGRLAARLAEGIAIAADHGAAIVFLPELTLSRYPADSIPADTVAGGRADAIAEPREGGPTHRLAAEAAARHGIHVHASLFERTGADDGRGRNTAIVVAPDGRIVAATHKLHIPVTAGYFEDRWFEAGPADGIDGAGPYPVHEFGGLHGLRLGLPTCWDEWFPEVARAYGLGGANVLAYPTAIGSEPDHPGVDTEPLWRQVIVGNGIANGLFMVVPNRVGPESRPDGSPGNTFYGSSFVSDPYGRILARAPRDREAVLVVDLDLPQRDDWLDLFPFFVTRRPETYGVLTEGPSARFARSARWSLGGGPVGLRCDASVSTEGPSTRSARSGTGVEGGPSTRSARSGTDSDPVAERAERVEAHPGTPA